MFEVQEDMERKTAKGGIVNELALFAGAGGGLLATKHLLGFTTVCYVEIEPYCIEVIKARIRDGYLDNAPIWDDVRTFNGEPWRGCVDIITAGFPCQPFSTAGKRNGANDGRNLWPDTVRVIREVRPGWVLLENVPGLLSSMDDAATLPHSYFGAILADLAQSGYNARWRVLSAAEVGAPHKRDRVFVVAHADVARRAGILQHKSEVGTKACGTSLWGSSLDSPDAAEHEFQKRVGQPAVFGVDTRLAHRVDRLAATGQGQVPAVVRTVWELMMNE